LFLPQDVTIKITLRCPGVGKSFLCSAVPRSVMKAVPILFLLCLGLLLAGCLAPGGGGTTPTPTPVGTTPTPVTPGSPAQLKYLLLDHYGESRFFYCDPDYWPVVRGDEQERAIGIFPVIMNDTDTFAAITGRLGLHPPYSDGEKLLMYREYKKLNAIPLEPMGDGTYRFILRLGSTTEGHRVMGIIGSNGTIRSSQMVEESLTCPICLAEDTLIDAPAGPVPVKDVREGMIVWTLTRAENREAVPVLSVAKVPVPTGHRMVQLRLSDGRELLASPGHPLADGRILGSLAVGEEVDGAVVVGAGTVPAVGGFTYDILPAGETGAYRANGIPMKSTLF
jgi:hypothetical protein